MAAHHLFRAFADLFSSPPGDVRKSKPAQSPAAAAAPCAPPPADPRPVGLGAANETFVTIDDIPNLFVDEGDGVVQFVPAFEEGARGTPFGTKILPELAPHWSFLREHKVPLKDAIAAAIRECGTSMSAPAPTSAVQAQSSVVQQSGPAHAHAHDPGATQEACRASHAPSLERRGTRESSRDRADMLASMHGRIVSWGEEKFPNRKPKGKPFYTSFAMRIATAMGEQVLQGEGLKDAIAESHCQVGDTVSVRRLRKIQVLAFREGGEPVMKDGQQVLWDKWLWSITR